MKEASDHISFYFLQLKFFLMIKQKLIMRYLIYPMKGLSQRMIFLKKSEFS